MRYKKRNKKGEMEGLIKILLWVAFFVIAIIATYFLIKFIKGLG